MTNSLKIMTPIGVECTFASDGAVRVRRVEISGQWLVVEQGRQWADEHGRHVLVMLPGKVVRELLLLPHSLTWQMKTKNQSVMIA